MCKYRLFKCKWGDLNFFWREFLQPVQMQFKDDASRQLKMMIVRKKHDDSKKEKWWCCKGVENDDVHHYREEKYVQGKYFEKLVGLSLPELSEFSEPKPWWNAKCLGDFVRHRRAVLFPNLVLFLEVLRNVTPSLCFSQLWPTRRF